MLVKYFIVDYCIYMYYITLLAVSVYYNCIIGYERKKERQRKKDFQRINSIASTNCYSMNIQGLAE